MRAAVLVEAGDRRAGRPRARARPRGRAAPGARPPRSTTSHSRAAGERRDALDDVARRRRARSPRPRRAGARARARHGRRASAKTRAPASGRQPRATSAPMKPSPDHRDGVAGADRAAPEDVHAAAERLARERRRRAPPGSGTARSAARDVVLGERRRRRAPRPGRPPRTPRTPGAERRDAPPALVARRARRERVAEPLAPLPHRRGSSRTRRSPRAARGPRPARAPAAATSAHLDAARARRAPPRASSPRHGAASAAAAAARPGAAPARSTPSQRVQPRDALADADARAPSRSPRASARGVGDVPALVGGAPAVELDARAARRSSSSISVEQLEQATACSRRRRRC